jgi:beta-carotene 3-hydroxylase
MTRPQRTRYREPRMVPVLLAVAAFIVMEPVTYAAHRWVMHGIGVRLHRSHHRSFALRRLEANDWFPVFFAAAVMISLAVGFNVPGWGALVPIGVGVTLYGVVYALVHDGYIHRRIPGMSARSIAALDRLADAHRLHHRFNSEPYGMLVPIIPAALRQRAEAADLRRLVDRQPLTSGSMPSQVPVES